MNKLRAFFDKRGRFGRLALRIYFVSLAQLLAIVAAVLVVGWLSFAPERGPDFNRRGRYVIDTITAQLGDPAALQRELDRAQQQMHVSVSLYGADGQLVATNVTPPLTEADVTPHHPGPPPAPPQLMLSPPGPHTLRIRVENPRLPGGFALYRHPPPPGPRDAGLWTIAIALVATAIASILLARSFARPLSQLSAAAKRFGTGDLGARAGLTRKDEFGELSQSFDEMAERVMQLVRSRQELLANVSHELRTPLARIRVALDLAADGAGDPELAREVLGEIAEDWAELERLVSDVLQTARLELQAGQARVVQQPLRLEWFSADALVERAAERFRAEHPARPLELRCQPELPRVQGDLVLLRRVLDNLLDNARKYSGENTSVMLKADARSEHLELCVEDQGIGISAEDLPRVGSPFFRTDPSRNRRTGGLGLGLSLARNIVEAHGGTLRIESELDKGTRVHVALPLSQRVQA